MIVQDIRRLAPLSAIVLSVALSGCETVSRGGGQQIAVLEQ
jgi:predicted small secreted protein